MPYSLTTGSIEIYLWLKPEEIFSRQLLVSWGLMEMVWKSCYGLELSLVSRVFPRFALAV
jgi:hypothetical protein